MLSVRPKIAELTFQVFGRSLHPELFNIFQTQKINRGNHSATIHITSVGHIVTWNHNGLTITEVATNSQNPLPERRRLIAHKLLGKQSDTIHLPGGVKYKTKFSLETINRKLFWAYQKELPTLGSETGLLHCFDSSGRFDLGAMSYVYAESRDHSLSIQAFHTFPDDYAIVKSESLIILPKKTA